MPETRPFAAVANRLINMLSTAAVWIGPERFEMYEKFTNLLEIAPKPCITSRVNQVCRFVSPDRTSDDKGLIQVPGTATLPAKGGYLFYKHGTVPCFRNAIKLIDNHPS
jgi:hypothetical protein